VTLCNSSTYDLQNIVKKADILISATGHANIIKGQWIKEGSVVIDVGTNPGEDTADGKPTIVGDIEYREAKKRARLITPVPGGVGPVTVSAMM